MIAPIVGASENKSLKDLLKARRDMIFQELREIEHVFTLFKKNPDLEGTVEKLSKIKIHLQ